MSESRGGVVISEPDIERLSGQLDGISHRLIAIEGRLIHLQTIGTWLFAGLLGSYAAILAVAVTGATRG